jgi:hypothetical protein
MCYKFLTSNKALYKTDICQVVTGDGIIRALGHRRYGEGTALTDCSNKVVVYRDGF